MRVIITFLFGSFVTAAAVAPLKDAVQEKIHVLGPMWQKQEALDAGARIPVRIALKQRNVEKGMDYLLEVSDPASTKYGKHYTAQQVADLFAPHDDTISVVKDWLTQHGIPANGISFSTGRGFLGFTTTVGHLESMLQTKYHRYSHQDGQGEQVASENYVLPDNISGHIDFVTPALTAPMNRKTPAHVQRSAARTKKLAPLSTEIVQMINSHATHDCSNYVTPQCIKAFYGLPNATLADPSNRLGIYQNGDEYPLQSDLDMFFKAFASNIPASVGPKVDLIDFGDASPNPDNSYGEAALDFDVAYPVIYPQGTELFQTQSSYNGSSGIGFFNQFLDAIDGPYCTSTAYNETGDDPAVDGYFSNEQCGTYNATNVISFSYTWTESSYPAAYLQRQCDEFMKLGLQGTTVVMGSGDGGVSGVHGDACLGKDHTIFSPLLSACPYIVSVGATTLPPGSPIDGIQSAPTTFASGGGFSNIWPASRWQQSAIDLYFKNHDPAIPSYNTSANIIPEGKGLFNRAGRAYPDIAAVGAHGVIVFLGETGTVQGTSMSGPIIAAIFTRLNEELIAAGKSRIGFVSPALYANPSMFNDITIGNQSAGGYCHGKGFKAVPGWDPVTGLGSPIYPEMLKYFLSIQDNSKKI